MLSNESTEKEFETHPLSTEKTQDHLLSTQHPGCRARGWCFANTNLGKAPALRNLEPILNKCNTDNLRIRHRNRCKETEEVRKVSWMRWDLGRVFKALPIQR